MCSATEPAEIVSAALYCSSPFARASQQFSSNEERKQRQQVNAGVNGNHIAPRCDTGPTGLALRSVSGT